MEAPVKRKTALTLIELLLVACIIFVLIGTFSFYAEVGLKVARETALRNELQNIRMAISYYHIVNKRFPDSLEKLKKERYIFLGGNYAAKREYLLDPFFNKYQYNNETGRVWTTTGKYQSW